jgi:PAS domain S-box-containing protein
MMRATTQQTPPLPLPGDQSSGLEHTPGARIVGTLSLSTSALVALTAAGHLVAWFSGVMADRGISVITMKTNTALCLLLLAIALLCLTSDAGPVRRLAGRVFAALALLIAAATFSENLAGWNLGIDQLLATEAPGALGMVSPNRMGSPASLSVVILAAALLLLSRERRKDARRVQAAALVVCVIGLLHTIGYLYGVQWLYGLARVSAIAWPTALCLVGLGVGLLCARPTQGIVEQLIVRDPGGSVVRQLLGPVLLSSVVLGWMEITGVRLGWFDPAMGTALLTVSFVVAILTLVWQAGRRGSRAAAELGAQQELLAVTLRSIGDAVIACDRDRRVTFLNSTGAALTGWTPEQAAGLPIDTIFQIVDERTKAPADDIVTRVLRENQVITLANHTSLVTKDRNVVPIEDSAAPIRNASGQLSGVVVVFHDVTEKRRAQEAIRHSEEKFAKVFHGSTSAMAVTTLRDGVFIDVNDRYLEVTGFARGAIVGKSSAELSVWTNIEARVEWLNELRRNGVVRNQERSFRKPDGTEWIGLVSSEIAEIQGEQVVISSITDITARRHQERRLEELSRLYAVLSKVNEAIVRAQDPLSLYSEVCRIVADEGQRPLVWIGLVDGTAVKPVASSGSASGYMLKLRVETEGELGRGPSGTSIREARPVVNDDFDTNNTTAPWREEARRYELRASAAFPLRHQGAVIGVLTLYAHEPGTFDDAQVRLLEGLSADISYALDKMWQEQALQESERSLREADRRKDEFLAMLSHELRNPLAPIRTGIYILEHTTPGSDQARQAQAVIQRQVTHMTRLVDDLLDIARISRGTIHLQREPINLAELVTRVAEDHRASFLAAGLDLQATVPGEPVRVNADRTRIAQAVGNLLHNARKFTPAGGRVAVALHADEHQARARIVVRDSGRGIGSEILPRLFQPFTQADHSLSRSAGGLGLGLALVKGLVELHQGHVDANSDGPGRGAEFVIYLPLEDTRPVAAEPGLATSPRGPRRVLVIEDNFDAAESLRTLLELAGHAVRVTSTGEEGLAVAHEFRPEVVFCDIGLPGMDGFAVARALRADPPFAGMRLVALSGYALQEDQQRAAQAGFDRHLAKPASPEAIARVLDEWPPAGATTT